MNTNSKKVKNLRAQLSIKNILVLTVLVVSGTIISCSPSQKETKQDQEQQIQTLQTIAEPEIPTTVTAVQEIAPVTETSKVPELVNAATTQPELNPPHGQPFHRCDIPVGSPLNSAAPATTNTTTSIQKTGSSPTIENTANQNNSLASNPTSPTLANSVAPELNPPHGEPFHRCDIPVGSPLASAAPATTATNTSPTIQRTGTSPTLDNAARLKNPMINNPTAPTLANSVAPKLNPPHGQPFHRCDIAVGSPLTVN